MRFLLLISIVFLLTLSNVFSQGVTLFGINPSNFPIISAKLFVFDTLGTLITPTINELAVTENQLARNIRVVQCSDMDTAKKLSIVITADVSGSMGWGAGNVSNMQLLKEGIRQIVNLLPYDSEIALTSFDNSQYLLQDFTKNKEVLLSKIPLLKPQGGTNYDQAMWVPFAGAIPVAKNGKNKRVVLFITDGQGGGDAQKIVKDAWQDSITIYCLTLSMAAPASLHYIANQTNGRVFDQITSLERMTSVIQEIFLESIEVSPCQIEWDGFVTCSTAVRNVELTYLPSTTTSIGIYSAPRALAVKELAFEPKQIHFQNKPLFQQYDTTLKVVAMNGDISVSNIVSVNNDYTITPSNFTVLSGDTAFLTVSYFPKDSGFTFSEIRFQTNECGEQIFYSTGGFRGKRPKVRTLKVEFPNGRENLIIGTDTILRWSGITSLDTVSIEYSVDKGKNWRLLTRQGSGLAYFWKNIPLPNSTECLLRVKQLSSAPLDSLKSYRIHREAVTTGAASPKKDQFVTISQDNTAYLWDVFTGDTLGRLRYGNSGIPSSVLYNSSANRIVTAHPNRVVFVWDANTVYTLFSLRGHTNTINSMVFSKDDSLLLTSSNDRTVRVWYPKTGALLATLGYHNDIVFASAVSNDRTKFATASRDGILRVWDAKTFDTIAQFIADGWGMEQCGFFPNNRWVFGSSDGKTVVFDVQNKQFQYVVGGMNATLNRNGTRMYTIGDDRIMRCWNSANGALLVSYIGHTGRVTGYQLSPDETKLLTFGEDRTARIFDAESGELLATVRHEPTNTPIITNAFFTYLGDFFITTSTDRTSRLWSADVLPLQQDTSDNVWNIIKPSLRARNLTFPDQIVGTSKDSMFMPYIENSGNFDANIDSIWITSTIKDEFEIVGNTGKQVVVGSNSLPIEIRFYPKQQGNRVATITILSSFDTLTYTVSGIGLEPSLELIGNYVDFGEVNLFQQKDSLRVPLAVNRGTASVNVTSASIVDPNVRDFLPIGTFLPITVNPGDTLFSDVAFKPFTIGRTSGRAAIEYDQIGSPLYAPLFGIGVNQGAELQAVASAIDPITCENEQRSSISISNSGISTLTLFSVEISGGNFDEFEIISFPTTIEPNETSTIEFAFRPNNAGFKQANIVINSNSITDTIVTIPVQARKERIAFQIPQTVDLGTVCFGTNQTININISNIGTLPSTIIYSNDLAIMNQQSLILQVGEQQEIQCNYLVNDPVGAFAKELYFTDTICRITDTVLVTGTVIRPEFTISPLQLFAIVGTQKRGYVQFSNTSSIDISIPSINLTSPFSLDTVFTELLLPANQTVYVPVVYTATNATSSKEEQLLIGNLCSESDTIIIEGIPTQAAMVVQIGSAEAYSGEQVSIPITVVSQTNTQVLGVQPQIEFTLQYNGSILYPVKNGGNIFKGDIREELLRYDIEPLASTVLDNLKFTAMLGSDSVTTLSSLNVLSVNVPIDLTVLPGTFKLLGICNEGGSRLVFGSDTNIAVSILQRNNQLEFEISTIENGKHEFKIFSSLGVAVIEPRILDNVGVQKKTIIIPIQAMANGMYMVQLKTPTVHTVVPFILQQ